MVLLLPIDSLSRNKTRLLNHDGKTAVTVSLTVAAVMELLLFSPS